MFNTAQTKSHEKGMPSLLPEQITNEELWTRPQQRLLGVLQQKEHRYASIAKICQLAGYSGNTVWYQAMEDERFVAAVQALGVKRSHDDLSRTQQRLLEVLQQSENRNKSGLQICRLAGYKDHSPWQRAIQDERFVAAVESLGVTIKRHHLASHLEVQLTTNIEEELAKDTWDMRRLKADYPKHKHPSAYEIDFSWIVNTVLREQVKCYFRHRLPRWKAATFKRALYHLKSVLVLLPSDVHVGTLQRSHVETLLAAMSQLSLIQSSRGLREAKTMFDYMATSPAWIGARPPRFLIWEEDIPSRPGTLPRPVPPNVLDQFDVLLEQAIQAMKQGQLPAAIPPASWDALLILRHTGMRAEDLAHLKAPGACGRDGCLDQDTEGYWWIRIHHQNTKIGKDHRIPTRTSDGVIDAIHRQQVRISDIPDHFSAHYLFRTMKGVLTYAEVTTALRKLAPHLIYEGKPYVITPHQFRHSLATDMIEQGVDIYTVKEFLGHASLSMTEKYVKVYLTSLKAKFDTYRAKKQQTSATQMMTTKVQVNHDAGDVDGGWAEGKVGKLYVSPLPDGIGNCAHLAMLDPCPMPPHCPTCPKLRASTRHLPMWESKARNLLITVEALRDNPVYARARQKHEQELRHTEKVIQTIKEEGFWDGRIHNS